MKVHKDLTKLPKFKNAILTIGSFDGVHLGHRKIIEQMIDLAANYSGETVVMTFDPHPRSVLGPADIKLDQLTTLEEKRTLLEDFGIDHLVVIPFTKAFSQLEPVSYIEDVLIQNFDPAYIVIGYDHHFGKDRKGSLSLLKAYGEKLNYKVIEISKEIIDELTISSTLIRESLRANDVSTANRLLGYPYTMSGTVKAGKQLGRELGFPTANLDLNSKDKLIPSDGIYVVKIQHQNKEYKGMLYIGDAPTIDSDHAKCIEVNIFDFDKNIYEQTLSVTILHHLRGDIKFDDIDALKVQMNKDKEETLQYFSETEAGADCDTTVAILTYNSEEHLDTYLSSVSFSSTGNFETVVIDNASNDNSLAYIEEWHPEISVIKLDENHGFAQGYNIGIEQIHSKYLVLLNSDVLVTENWLDPLITYMDAHPLCAGVMPKVRSISDKAMFEHAGAAGGFIDSLGYPFCRGRILDTVESDNGQYDTTMPVFWITGAACLIRTDLFKKVGGFDPLFFAHQEEIDLCWRLNRLGHHFAVIPESVVYHLGGGTLAYGNPRKVYLNFRNNLSMIFKNEPSGSLMWKLPVRLVLDGIAGLKFLVCLKPGMTLAIIKAHLSFYSRIPYLMRMRREFSNLLAGSPAVALITGRVSKSILIEYYLKGKKTFSEIF